MIIKSRVDILSDMVKWGRNNSSSLTDFNTGSVIRSIYNAIASQLAQLYYNVHKIYRSSRILYANGSDLDKLVAGRSIKRKSAVKASAEIQFTGVADTVIPTGTKIGTSDGITFQTVESRFIGEDGGLTVTIQAECTNSGISGNVKAGKIVEIIDSVSGLESVNNVNQSKGGQDYENDELLRSRTINQYAGLSLGIEASYNAWAIESNESVLKAIPQYGHPSVSLNTIIVHVVKDNGGIFTVGELDSIGQYIQTYAPLGLIIDVRNIAFTRISISAQIRIRSGYDLNTVSTYITDNLNIYLDYKERDWGEDIDWSDIYTLINNTEGVDDVSVSQFVPSENIIISDYSIPILDTIIITEW